MKPLDLYKFIHKNELEYHWHDDRFTGRQCDQEIDVMLFIPTYHIEEFNKLLGHKIMDEDGIKCTMKDGYFAFWMKDICDHFDIELTEIFEKEEL